MSTSVTIPIAGFKDVYDVPSVEKALQDLPPGANEALRATYEKMQWSRYDRIPCDLREFKRHQKGDAGIQTR